MQKMILSQSLASWRTDLFNHNLKLELAALPSGTLPLQKGVNSGGYVDDADISITVLRAVADENYIRVHVGVFFTEIVICCGCGVDPMPENAYCEIDVIINKETAVAEFVFTND